MVSVPPNIFGAIEWYAEWYNLLGLDILPQGWLAVVVLAGGVTLSFFPNIPNDIRDHFGYVTLKDALQLAYERSRRADESASVRTEAERMRVHFLFMIIENKSGLIQMEGVKPPSKIYEIIAPDSLNSHYLLSDDFSGVLWQTNSSDVKYEAVRMRRTQLRAHIQRLMEKGGPCGFAQASTRSGQNRGLHR